MLIIYLMDNLFKPYIKFINKVYLIKILDLIKLIFYTCKLIIIFLRIKDEKSSILSDF